ncbi:MarR family transcriptional regulator [Novosphingobium kunmingense]|uniref:MarR family transcriptional regulator n=1 Tax=Novosphingobium kunmingense TaxID=1211806 RepID=UPI001E4D3DF5|nr:helix-turn-helix domain-containing protein [Novosphingobium kunmingense]
MALARIEGALPFLGSEVADGLALASLRRLWRVHVRDFPQENQGPEHNPGIEAAELTRSWYTAERRDFLSWIARRGSPPLARAARLALAAKGATESFASVFEPADRALDRLDALLPARDPVATLSEWLEQLREDEIEFRELGSEEVVIEGKVFQRFAARGSAWAASLAVAMRPHVFSLGAAPLALAGLAPRSLFRAEPESPFPALLGQAITAAAADVATDLAAVRTALALGDQRLARLYASSQAPAVWQLIAGLGPLTRAELARALGVTRRTASQAATALEKADLAVLRPGDHALAPKTAPRAS